MFLNDKDTPSPFSGYFHSFIEDLTFCLSFLWLWLALSAIIWLIIYDWAPEVRLYMQTYKYAYLMYLQPVAILSLRFFAMRYDAFISSFSVLRSAAISFSAHPALSLSVWVRSVKINLRQCQPPFSSESLNPQLNHHHRRHRATVAR